MAKIILRFHCVVEAVEAVEVLVALLLLPAIIGGLRGLATLVLSAIIFRIVTGSLHHHYSHVS